MTAGDAEVLASLRLVQGRSDSRRMEFGKSSPQALVTVGSDPSCDWLVEEMHVAPIAFSLHWDGSSLRVADTHGAGRLRVDGTAVGNDWRRIGGRARVDFGNAAIVIEAFSPKHEAGAWGPTAYQISRPEAVPNSVFPPSGKTLSNSPPSSSVRPASNEASGGKPGGNGSTRPPRPVGGTSLADLDQRTMQGYVMPARAVHVVGSVTIAGMATETAPEPPTPQAILVTGDAASRPALALDASPVGTSLVVQRAEEPDSRVSYGSRSAEPVLAGQGRNLPSTVLVLSPVAGSAEDVGLPHPPPQLKRSTAPQPHGWGAVALGLASTVVVYLCWIYLLYNL